MTATLIILAIWIAFVWFLDPDGFSRRGRSKPTRRPAGATKPTEH